MRQTALLSALGASIVFGVCGFVNAANVPAPPPTPIRPVTNDYHGVKVTDDYRWLENFSSPEVRKWSDEQNTHTRSILDRLPERRLIEGRLKQLYDGISSEYFDLEFAHGNLFAMKSEPPKEQPFLIMLKSADDTTSQWVIVDPNQIDPGGTTAIDFYMPSHDARYVAVSLSKGGSEKGTVHVYDVAAGKELPDTIPRVNNPTAGGSVTWNADASGFYYTRYPRDGERPPEDRDFYQQVYFHKLGTPASEDVYVIGKDFPRIAEIVLQSSDDGRYVCATVENGDGGDYQHYLLGPSGKWTQLTLYADRINEAVIGPDSALYMYSHKDASRGRILRVPLSNPLLSDARVVVPESDVVIGSFDPTNGLLYVADMVGGDAQIRIFDHQGNFLKTVPIEPASSVWRFVRTTGDEVLFSNESYTTPQAWFRYDPKTGQTTKTQLFSKAPADFSDIDVVRVFATSKDGTKVPMTILIRKGTQLDGRNPALLTGYGGYGISQTPHYSFTLRIWLDQGGIYAVGNIRGGGEYGEAWHLAGNLTHKQNVFDDFTACAQYLIKSKYTSPAHLAVEGGSNGGLLMGAVMTQHPELFRAVVAHSGIYDMLRVELAPNGAFNVTEFGTVKDPEQFKALYAYSPYHRVTKGTAYPATLFLTGDNDGRVDPSNSRKMVAELQAATSSGLPIMLRTTSSAGHGIGSSLSEVIAERADVYSFLFEQLGIKYVPSQ